MVISGGGSATSGAREEIVSPSTAKTKWRRLPFPPASPSTLPPATRASEGTGLAEGERGRIAEGAGRGLFLSGQAEGGDGREEGEIGREAKSTLCARGLLSLPDEEAAAALVAAAAVAAKAVQGNIGWKPFSREKRKGKVRRRPARARAKSSREIKIGSSCLAPAVKNSRAKPRVRESDLQRQRRSGRRRRLFS